MDADGMKELKAQRSSLKAKVKTSATRLQKGITKKGAESTLKTLYNELEASYVEFTGVDVAYSEAIDEDESLKDEFYMVNQMTTQEYSHTVEETFTTALTLYDQYILEKTTKDLEELKGELSRLWTKIDHSVETAQIERDLKRVETTICLVSILKEKKADHQSVDWGPLMEDIEETLSVNETREDVTNNRLHKMKTSLNTSSSTLPVTTPTLPLATHLPQGSPIMSTSISHSQPLHSLLSHQLHPSLPYHMPAMPSIVSQPFTSIHHMSTSAQLSLPDHNIFSQPSTLVSPFTQPPAFVPPSSSLAPPLSLPAHTSIHSPTFLTSPLTHQNPPIPQIPASSLGFQIPSSSLGNPVSHPMHSQVKVKKAELPKFSGQRQDWPEFQCIWPKLAVPAFPCKETLALELRRCCKDGLAENIIRNIAVTGPNSFDEMWRRLSDHYGDEASSINEILRKLQNLKPVRSEDYKALIEFTNKIEGCYSQLLSLNQLECISMLQVDNLALLLPTTAREVWHELYQRLATPDRLHPFRAFASYLVSKRKDVSRLAEQQPTVNKKKEVTSHHVDVKREDTNNNYPSNKILKPNCAVCKNSSGHKTDKCFVFKKMTRDEKVKVLKEVNGCFRCFLYHPRGQCRYREPCGLCNKTGHHTLMCMTEKESDTPPDWNANVNKVVPVSSHISTSSETHNTIIKPTGVYAIFSARVFGSKNSCTIFTDNGSDSSYITNSAARRWGAKSQGKYILHLTTTGGQEKEIESTLYKFEVVTKSGQKVPLLMFGIEQITGKLSQLNMPVLSKLFPEMDTTCLQRNKEEVDVLVGTDFFGLHPKRELAKAGDNLSVMEGDLGVCLQGSHPLLQLEPEADSHNSMISLIRSASTIHVEAHHSRMSVRHPVFESNLHVSTHAHLNQITAKEIGSYIQGEELGTQISQKCGSCKCGKCPQPGHAYSFQEEVELDIIRKGLHYNAEEQHWIAKYPWKFDPRTLPYNRAAACSTLRSLERKLCKNESLAQTYKAQMDDMIERKVARKVTSQEIDAYRGPVFYISHLGVLNPKSKSTPYRLVFNSSQLFKGVSLNNWLYKGPEAYMNNQIGVLLRWREEEVGIAGDIRKMYNSVHLDAEDQHCHRFLWSNLNYGSEPETYVITRVNMGDRPAGTITTEAIYMTAEMFKSENPRAAEFLKVGSYVDDLLESVESKEEASELVQETEGILMKGGFKIKFWTLTGDKIEEADGITEVLGVCWTPERDVIIFRPSLNFSPKKHGVHTLPDLEPHEIPQLIPEKLTKRNVLSQVMRIYDPLGIICAFTLRGKILLRETWENNTGWDDEIDGGMREKWMKFFCGMYELRELQFPRSTKPVGAVGKPNLILLSDASEVAYGTIAYAHWECKGGRYATRMIYAKNKIAPLTKRTTPQLELNAAVLSKRVREIIEKEMRYQFNRVLHLIDSLTVLAMLHKVSTRFRLFEGVRVSEIQTAHQGDISDWAWVPGHLNTADWLTRGKDPAEISEDSEWFTGPTFMAQPIDQWELQFKPSSETTVPGEKKIVTSHVAICKEPPINYMKFNCYRKLIRTVARILNMCQEKKLVAVKDCLNTTLLEKAEMFLIRDVQTSIQEECEKTHEKKVGGKYYRLRPTLVNGYWKIGTRLAYNPMVPDGEPQYLLPTDHRVTVLAMIQAHKDSAHRGRDSTVARFRQKFWALNASRLARSVVFNCVLCKLRKPKLLSQRMGNLPEERTKPAPPWTYCMCDYFGPMQVRGEVQKRTTGKAYGIIITDLVMRAIHLEAVFSYGADAFLVAFSKFVSIRGYPRKMYSDPGSNLTSASKELADEWKGMWSSNEKEKIITKSSENGMDWIFSAADAPWQNGAVESLVKSVKKCIHFSMQNQRLTPTEFSALLYEVMNTVNERPIGAMSEDSELSVLTPNSLLLGRSVAKNPGGWHPTSSTLLRFQLVQTISETFWSQWMKVAAPGLVIDAKWQLPKRNLQVGDIVLILEGGVLRAEYRLGRVEEVYPGEDGLVRKAKIVYRRYKVGDVGVKYTGSIQQFVIRPVQRLVMVLPVESRED